MDGSSGDDREPHVGIGDRQGMRRNVEDVRLRGSASGNLGDNVLETGFPGLAPIAKFGTKLGTKLGTKFGDWVLGRNV
jgi:hypothetical protein